jgi:hypothetical protein
MDPVLAHGIGLLAARGLDFVIMFLVSQVWVLAARFCW